MLRDLWTSIMLKAWHLNNADIRCYVLEAKLQSTNRRRVLSNTKRVWVLFSCLFMAFETGTIQKKTILHQRRFSDWLRTCSIDLMWRIQKGPRSNRHTTCKISSTLPVFNVTTRNVIYAIVHGTCQNWSVIAWTNGTSYSLIIQCRHILDKCINIPAWVT